MKTIKLLLFLPLLALIAACGSVKSTVHTVTQTDEASVTTTDSTAIKTTHTQAYGDTLKGVQAVVFDQNGKADTINVRSQGIDLGIIVMPKADVNGYVIGANVKYNVVAKPVSTTTTTEKTKATKQVNTAKQITGKVDSNTTTQAGWSVPKWFWWVLLVVVAAAAVYLDYRNYLKQKSLNANNPHEN